tara:strand:- start:536 stop:1135 length:600 start_codon:yes stop_codon:yes gene_type:complete
MFTGIITDIGELSEIKKSDKNDTFIGIDTKWNENFNIGSSICCNGVCLTVVKKKLDYFGVELSSETISKTNFQYMNLNDKINLEKSLKIGDELGGHNVTGHVDGMANLSKVIKIKSSFELWFEVSESIIIFLAEKGSITLNGVSLTINHIDNNFFSVNIIKHTWENTNLSSYKIGSFINLEVDIISRYVSRHTKNYIKL